MTSERFSGVKTSAMGEIDDVPPEGATGEIRLWWEDQHMDDLLRLPVCS
jgi:hypothetical protein